MAERPRLRQTPSQTAGPYVHIGLMPDETGFRDFGLAAIVGPQNTSPTKRIVVGGRILDGAGMPVSDAIVEFWHADADGREAAFRGRAACNDAGAYHFETFKPGRLSGPGGAPMAPHITLWIVARGINVGLHSRLYLEDEPEANAGDFVLQRVPIDRQGTLIAKRSDAGDRPRYVLDIRLQGEGETVFFEI